jgi:hypothetical protein
MFNLCMWGCWMRNTQSEWRIFHQTLGYGYTYWNSEKVCTNMCLKQSCYRGVVPLNFRIFKDSSLASISQVIPSPSAWSAELCLHTALSDFFFYRIYMKLLHFALSSLVNKAARFNVICVTDLLHQVLPLFSPCKYEVIYRSSLHACSF